MATKKLTVELTPAQARTIVWAINILEASYEGHDDEFSRDAMRSIRHFEKVYNTVADYAEANGR